MSITTSITTSITMPKERSRILIVGLSLAVALTFITFRAIGFWHQVNNSQKSVSVESTQPLTNTTERSPEELADLHLFGRPETFIEKPPEVREDLPETHLKLTLRGVSLAIAEQATDDNMIAAHFAKHVGGALIEGPDRATEFFRIGSTLPGNAKLHSVYTDRVVIDRKGKLENLSFPEDWASVGGITSITPSGNESGFFTVNGSNSDNNNIPVRRKGNSFDAESAAERLATQAQLFEDRVMLGQSEATDDPDSSSETNHEEAKSRLQQLRDLIRQQRTQ